MVIEVASLLASGFSVSRDLAFGDGGQVRRVAMGEARLVGGHTGLD